MKNKQYLKKKNKKTILNGKVHIYASYNNTLVYITDMEGNTLGWKTAGSKGFKGSRKCTPYAAQIAAKSVSQHVKDMYKLISVEIYIKGPGPGRESAIRGISNFFKITLISDVTNIPHNGCRPPKERRI